MKIAITCPACNEGLPMWIQQCYHCGKYIYWQGQGDEPKIPEVRKSLKWPQRAEILTDGVEAYAVPGDGRSTVLGTYSANSRLVAVRPFGNFIELEHGGFVHFSNTALFGKLRELPIIDPSGNATSVNVLDSPKWGDTPDERGNVIYTLDVGTRVQIWEVTPNWIRINRWNSHWLPRYWLDEAEVAKLE